jgi:nucleoside-diphosphate-sugar epimerase
VYLITGGLGMTGRLLAERLASEGMAVRILDNQQQPEKRPVRTTDFVQGDLCDFNTVNRACTGVDVVFHLGAIQPVSRAKARQFQDINVTGTRNVLEASRQCGVSKVVYVSSSIVYGVPDHIPLSEDDTPHAIGAYGESKIEAERLCQDYFAKGLDTTIIRPRTIVGPGRLGLFWILFDWVRRGKKIYLIGEGKNRFQFVHLFDMVEACRLAVEKGSGETFNVGSSHVDTVYEEMSALVSYAQSSSKISPLNPTLLRSILRLTQWLRSSPLSEEHYLVADKDFVLDSSKAERILGWTPKYSNQESLIAAYDWYLKNHEQIPPEYQGILKLVSYIS